MNLSRNLFIPARAATLALLALVSSCAGNGASPSEPLAAQDLALTRTGAIRWSMAPRAALARQAYHLQTNGGEFDPSYVHPDTFSVQVSLPSSEAGVLYQWTAHQPGNAAVTSAWAPSSQATLQLPQGEHELFVQKKVGTTVTLVDTTTIDVRDIVIVAMGDSMSSGEGDPETWARHRWAIQPDNCASAPAGPGPSVDCTPVPVGPDFQYDDDVPPFDASWLPAHMRVFGTVPVQEPGWMVPACHRSMNSGTARAVVEYERQNPHLSVTFLDYACSGAESKHLHTEQQTSGHAVQFQALINDANKNGVARPVEHLIMSIGINDLGFRDIITDCMWPGDPSTSCTWGAERQAAVDGLARLPAAYANLDSAIKAELPFVKRIDLLEYPGTSVFQRDDGANEACGELNGSILPDGDSVTKPTELTNAEMIWLRQVGAQLVYQGKLAAHTYGWNYIVGVDQAFQGHGRCASNRFFNAFAESETKQLDMRGMFHPNQRGYAAMAGVITAFLTSSESASYETIGYADVTGDGLPDLCGRGDHGILCLPSDGGSFTSTPVAGRVFPDDEGWFQAGYYSTVAYADINGDGKKDVCARGFAGVSCALAGAAGFGATSLWTALFSVPSHGNDPQYISTLAYPDVNGDGKADFCGRGSTGIWCAKSNGSAFTGAAQWTPAFNNAGATGSDPMYYSTIHFPDLDGDGKADVCGRNHNGINCALSSGNGFGPVTIWSNLFAITDMDYPRYYQTIAFPDVNGDGKADVCGRSSMGIWCATSTGSAFTGVALWSAAFTDANHWGADARYFSTISYPDVNGDGKADVCGRGPQGIACALSSGNAFTGYGLWNVSFSDAAGWGAPKYYRTLHFVDLNGDGRADVCGRGTAGVYCSMSTGSALGPVFSWDNAFSDANRWDGQGGPAVVVPVEPGGGPGGGGPPGGSCPAGPGHCPSQN